MTPDEKTALAQTGIMTQEAVGKRLAAARNSISYTQEALGEVAGIGKAAVANAEKGRAWANDRIMYFLFVEHRIDFNFIMAGAYAQLPGDVQDRLFSELAKQANVAEQKPS